MNSFLEGIKFLLKWEYIWAAILIIIGFIKIYKYKEEKEKYFLLKMIGFYLMGSFSFNFYWFDEIYIYLPVGFFIYYIFMKNKEWHNKIAKDKCAKWGLIILCITFISSGIYNYLEYRDINVSSTNKIKNLSKEWKDIKEKCSIGDNIPLNGARVLYDKNGNINDLNYYIIDYDKNKSYQVNLNNSEYNILVEKYNYNFTNKEFLFNGITTDDFIEVIDYILDNNSSKEKEIYSHNIIYQENESMIYDEEDDLNLETFVITKNKGNKKYEKVNPKDLSVSKPFISYYADGYKGYDIFQYIFDLDNYKK